MNTHRYAVGILAVVATIFLTAVIVHRLQKPDQLDVITAQSMDMSSMRPPVGAAPVVLATVRTGSVDSGVAYTGSIVAYNEQVITSRVTGTIISLPVYPGDSVSQGQLIAQLDTAELGQKTEAAKYMAAQSMQAAEVALLTHHLHHQSALDQASANRLAAVQAVTEAQADASAATASVTEAQANLDSSLANNEYWSSELPRESALEEAGAVSQEDYQNELASSKSAESAVAAARAKLLEAHQAAASASAKVAETVQNAAAADAGAKMALADLSVAAVQVGEAQAGAESAKASSREAEIVEGYAHIAALSPGIVTERPVSAGTLVQPGQEIVKIEEIDRVRIQANVAVSDLAGITVGTSVTIETGMNENQPNIEAKVTSIFPAANSETRTAVVEAVVPNTNKALLPGAFVTMNFHKISQNPGLVVPSSAIVAQDGPPTVWRVNGSSIANPVTVTVVASDGNSSEIAAAGLFPGDQVVSEGALTLADGEKVVPADWGTSGPATLPTVAEAERGQTLYRCSKCGMTYSAADAKKFGYVDPMDGGKLVPVQGATR